MKKLLLLLLCSSVSLAVVIDVPKRSEVTNIAVNAAANYQNTNSVYGNLIAVSGVYSNLSTFAGRTITNFSLLNPNIGLTLTGTSNLTVSSSGKYLISYSLSSTGALNQGISGRIYDTVNIYAPAFTSLNETNWVSCSGSGILHITTNILSVLMYSNLTNEVGVICSWSLVKIAP